MKSVLILCYTPSSAEELDHIPESVAAVVNSYINPSVQAKLAAKSIMTYSWEVDFINASRQFEGSSPKAFNNYKQLLTLDELDINYLIKMFERTIFSQSFNFYACLRWYIDYFDIILTKHSVTSIITKSAPHSFGDYVLVAYAKALRLCVIGCIPFFGWSNCLYAAYSFNRQRYISHSQCNSQLGLLPDKFVAHINDIAFRSLNGRKLYPYDDSLLHMINNGRKHFISAMIKSLRSSEPYPYLEIANQIAEVKRLVSERVSTKIPRSFAVLFLSYEPEASLTPLGGSYWNQLQFVATCNLICKQLELPLLIREHPDFMRLPFEKPEHILHYYLDSEKFARNQKFYDEILLHSQVIGMDNSDVPTLLSSPELSVVFTVSGSISLEAMLARKIVVVGASTPLASSRVFSLNEISDDNLNAINLVSQELKKLSNLPSCEDSLSELILCIQRYLIDSNTFLEGINIGSFMKCLTIPEAV